MRHAFTHLSLWVYPILLLTVCACLFMACAKQPQVRTPDSRNEKLQRTLAKREASLKEMEDHIAAMQLRLLEKDAHNKKLEERLISQQAMLDEAVLEVVRAKAKLRSLESKAEAASEMAEAEIAVKALKIQAKGQEPEPDVVRAEELLKMSVKEFEKENYGGALYLTSQAKGHLRSNQVKMGGEETIEPVQGEILFAQPVPLRVLRTSNLRRGPGINNEIVAKLVQGASLIGYSYKGQWVRVTVEDGTSGWIYQTLVGGR